MQSLHHSRTSTSLRRAYTFFVIAALLLSVLPALQIEPAGAQDGTPEAAEQPSALHTYFARKAVCPPGTILADANRETLFEGCVEPLENVSFTLAGDTALYPGDTRTTQIQPGGPAAFTSWPEIPVGMPYTVTETIPDGYGEPWVFCEYFLDAPGNVADDTSYGAAPGGRASYQINEPAYQNVICTWFNIALAEDAQATPGAVALRPQDDLADIPVGEIEPVGTGRVILRKHYCPTGFELIEPSLSVSNGDCDNDGPHATFTLTYGGGTTSPKELEGTPPTTWLMAEWTDIPAGTIRITEPTIDGYETLGVYCKTAPEGTTPTFLEDVWSPGDRWAQYQLQEGSEVVCEWFNVRLPQLGDAGTVSVYKEYCPAGYVPADVGEPYSSNDCQLGGPDVSYELTHGNQLGPPVEASGNTYAWYGIPGSAVSITEEPPAMYETAAVYCDSYEGVDPDNPSAAAAPPPDRVPHEGNTLNWDLVEGNYLRCIWQNAPVDDAYGNLLLIKRACPEGYAFGSKPIEDVLAECTEHQASVQFDLAFESGETAQATTQQGDQGAVASLSELPLGNVQVTETPPEGYALRRVYCTRYQLSETPELPDSSNSDQEPVTGNGFAYVIDPGLEASCYLFDVQGEDGALQAGSVFVTKYECPPGFASTNPTQISLSGTCSRGDAGTEFTASDDDQIFDSGETDGLGQVVLSGIPAGPFRLSELPREGYDPPRVFCLTTLIETGANGALEEVTINLWGITYDLPDGYALQCQWYNMPTGQASTDPATVLLHKYGCPEGYDFNERDVTKLTADCTSRTEGIDFLLDAGGTQTTGTTDASGDAQFTNVAPGSFLLQEPFNQGYEPVAVFCDVYFSATGSANDDYFYGSSAVNAYVPAGYTLECKWFNAPFIEPAEIDILKYVCPPNYGIEGAAREDVLFTCATPAFGVYFTATGNDDYLAAASTDRAGAATFENVPGGPIAIVEHAVSYETVRVYCGEVSIDETSAPATWQEMTIVDQAIEYQVQPGTRITCYWINFETDYPSVIVHKYSCGDAVLPAEPLIQDLREMCASAVEGVNFELTAEGTVESQTTDADGNAYWSGLNEGTITLRETNPGAGSIPYVYCADFYVGGEPQNDSQRLIENYTDEFHLDGGYYVECSWFNFQEQAAPAQGSPTPTSGNGTGGTGGNGGTGGTGGTSETGGQGGGQTGGQTGGQAGGQTGGQTGGQPAGATPDPDAPATLIITKYTCEPGYDVHAPDSDPAGDCDELTDEVAFALAVESEEDVETRTTGEDDEGTVEYVDLEAGAYLLTETLPEGTAAAFIYTCQSDQRQFQEENPFKPFAYAGPDGRIGVVLVAGETLECDWYNVPEPPGTLTLTKYWCAGEVVILNTCEIYTEGIAFTLMPLGGGEGIPLTTGEDGTATAEVEGVYELIEDETEWCFVESEAVDAEGNVTIDPGAQVSVTIYNCGPQPGEGG